MKVQTIYLTADNMTLPVETIAPWDDAYIALSSDSATATSRTFTLNAPSDTGIRVTIVWSAGSGQLASTGTASLQGGADWLPQTGDCISLISNGTTWVESWRASNASSLQSQESTGTLTQANIVGMNATPVTLLAAPGAGKVIIVDEIELAHIYSTAAYTTGGDVSIEYATSATPIQVFDVAVITASASANYLWKPTASYSSTATASSQTDLSTSLNKAVEITNATAAFAAGNAANIFKWRLRYHVVTVLS